MANKPIYVTLDAMLPADETQEGEDQNLLVKKVDEAYLGKTFKDVIQKVLDPEADQYNQEYNARETAIVEKVSGWFNEMNANPQGVKVSVVAITNDSPPQEIRVGLDEKVSKYNDRILKTREDEDTSGQKVKYNLIDLCVAKNTGGGYELTATLTYEME